MRPGLLYVCPVMPARTGNGLAMRAGAVLRALAGLYRVTVLVEARYAGAPSLDVELRALCADVAVVPTGADTATVFPDVTFDVVHVFRLAALQAAGPFLTGATTRHLDLDDIESETHRRLAALYRQHGYDARAEVELAEADRAARIESFVLRLFHRVYVCSDTDRARLAGRGSAEIRVLPNVVPLRPAVPAPTDGMFTFLFVGTLGYYPNAEGVWWWCREVLPLLRARTSRPFRLAVVGAGGSDMLGGLRTIPEVEIVGPVADVADWYARAHAAIIPIRAGGGTRIKLLEAFSFRRPVVSTSLGAEGIDALHDREVLLADTPAAYADQCARLLADAGVCARLVEAGVERLLADYLPTVLPDRLAAQISPSR